VLATQSIEARERQEGRMQACTIGLSINEDTKLEKGKEKKSSTARCFMRSSRHVTAICGNLWQFASTVILSKIV